MAANTSSPLSQNTIPTGLHHPAQRCRDHGAATLGRTSTNQPTLKELDQVASSCTEGNQGSEADPGPVFLRYLRCLLLKFRVLRVLDSTLSELMILAGVNPNSEVKLRRDRSAGFPACGFWRLSSRQFPHGNTGLESPVTGLWQKLWVIAVHFQCLLLNFQFRIWFKLAG